MKNSTRLSLGQKPSASQTRDPRARERLRADLMRVLLADAQAAQTAVTLGRAHRDHLCHVRADQRLIVAAQAEVQENQAQFNHLRALVVQVLRDDGAARKR